MSYNAKLIAGVLFTLRPHNYITSSISCPNGHGGMTRNYCSECGAKLTASVDIEKVLEDFFAEDYRSLSTGDYEAFYQVDVLQDVPHYQTDMELFHIPTEDEIMENVEIIRDIENVFEILEKRIVIGLYHSY